MGSASGHGGGRDLPQSVGARIRTSMITEPKRYQVQAVRFLESLGGRGILGDDMGLGKTYEAIAWLAINPKVSRVVVVCPANVKWQWQRMFMEHAGLNSEVLEGVSPYYPSRPIVIINYEILRTAVWPEKRNKNSKPTFPWVDQLLEFKPQAVFIDEFHYIKTMTSLQTQACKLLSGKIKHIIAASGTPIEKSPVEFYPTLKLVAKGDFNSFWKYAFRYCDPKPAFRGRGWDFNGSDNLEELHERVAKWMIRRLKVDVAKELPPKIRISLPVDITNRKKYQEAADDFLKWIKKNQGKDAADRAANAVRLVRLGTLKRIASEGKIKAIKSWITDFLEQSNEKLIVFCVHRPILNKLLEIIPGRVAHVSGSVTGRKRQAMVDQFIEDPKCRVFVGQMKAAGVGVDGLHKVASSVLFTELGWNASEHDQAEDRALRIGQTATSVNVYYMIAQNTVEEKVMEMIQAKYDICNEVLDGGVRGLHLFDRRSLHAKANG